MGIDMYLVEYKSTEMPRNREFFDLLQSDFCAMDITSHTYIERDAWDEFLGEHPELLEKFKEEIKCINTLLKDNFGAIEVSFC